MLVQRQVLTMVSMLNSKNIFQNFFFRCMCISFLLAVPWATKEALSRNLEFLIRETYEWFSKFSQRRFYYRQLYNTLNDGQDPLNIVTACDTKWLSIETTITRIIHQWEERKLLFKTLCLKKVLYISNVVWNAFGHQN